MKMRGIEFGSVFNASGARNFFGDGYWFHSYWKPFGLNYAGSTFVAKTTTLSGRTGNMPLDIVTLEPEQLVPKCIIVKPFKNVTLNAVGLSGPGAERLLEIGEWQERTEPFLLSFMSVKPTLLERLRDTRDFVTLLKEHLPKFRAPVGLQLNLSCPNAGVQHDDLVMEARETLTTANYLGIPLLVKINALVSPQDAAAISQHPACDAIVCSNTIPWGALPIQINWRGLFGSDVSPLAEYGGGGLSGEPLRVIVFTWISHARMAGVRKPIVACGGILSPMDVRMMRTAGASAIEIGAVALLRPWRVRSIIRTANAIFATPKEESSDNDNKHHDPAA